MYYSLFVSNRLFVHAKFLPRVPKLADIDVASPVKFVSRSSELVAGGRSGVSPSWYHHPRTFHDGLVTGNKTSYLRMSDIALFNPSLLRPGAVWLDQNCRSDARHG